MPRAVSALFYLPFYLPISSLFLLQNFAQGDRIESKTRTKYSVVAIGESKTNLLVSFATNLCLSPLILKYIDGRRIACKIIYYIIDI